MTTLEQRKNSLGFDLLASIRYHNYRIRFFECWDRMSSVVAVVFGSSVMYNLSQQNTELALYSGLFGTVLSALALVVGFGQRAREHRDFKMQFAQLEYRLSTEPLSEMLLKNLSAEVQLINSKEPPPLIVLGEICHNEQVKAEGFDNEHLSQIAWYQRLFAHYVDLCPHKIFEKLDKM